MEKSNRFAITIPTNGLKKKKKKNNEKKKNGKFTDSPRPRSLSGLSF